MFLVATVLLLALFLLLGRHWQNELRALMGMPAEPATQTLLAPAIALAGFAVLLLLGRVVRGLGRWLGRLLARWTSPRAARALGVLVTVGLVAGLLGEVALDGFFAATDRSFALANGLTPEGVRAPVSSLRSGGPGSLVGWETLGREGRTFVAGGPTATAVGAFTGTAAPEPIRVYAGLDSAPDAEARARVAVMELERTGAFQRSRMLVATTTGQGWLDAAPMTAFEYLSGGDSAIVTMQYS